MMEKVNTLSMGEKIIVGAGIVMLIASFLPWYDVDVAFEGITLASASRSGWQSPGAIWSILATLIGVIMAGAVLAPKLGNVRLPDLGQVTWGQALLGMGVVAVIFVLLKLLNESSYMAFGFFIGIIAAIALAVGGYLVFSEEKSGVVRT
jgi:hypothetical protein